MSIDRKKRSVVETVKFFISGFSGFNDYVLNLTALTVLGAIVYYLPQGIWFVLVNLVMSAQNNFPEILAALVVAGRWWLIMLACGAGVCITFLYITVSSDLDEQKKREQREDERFL